MMLDRLFSDANPEVLQILERALDGHELSIDDAELLLRTEGDDFHALTCDREYGSLC